MDHESWLSQVVSTGSKDSNTEGVVQAAAATKLKHRQEPDYFSRDSRYAHDMAQAELMRGSRSVVATRTTSPKSTEVTSEDFRLGLQGLERAQSYRRKGDLESALKLYELSIELLLKYLKACAGEERASIETRIHAALSDAEHVKTNLLQQRENQPASKPQIETSSSFRSFTNALCLALGASTPNATPLSVSKTTSNFRPPANKQKRPTPRGRQQPLNNSLPTSNVNPDFRRQILSDFYVPPTDLQRTTWDAVAGLEMVKQSIQEAAILPLVRPDLFTGLRKPQNILLYGPPGTGKTMLVRAAANESGSHLFVVTSSAVTSKFMGEAEKLVRTLFQVARELAPCILFLDELDALLSIRKGDGSEHEASRRMKTEFMVQMDGIRNSGSSDGETAGHHVLIIGCTNCPWDVDPAVLRRFPRRIFVPLPDDDARRGLIQLLLRKVDKHSLTSRHISTLVKRTSGFSGSDITAIASEASFGPLRDLGGLEKIRDVRPENVRPLMLKDFETVLNQTTKSISDAQLQRYDEWKKQQAAPS